MKNYYLTEVKLKRFMGDKVAPNMREEFMFGRDCVLVSQTEHARWWTSEKIYNKLYKENNEH